VHPTRFERVTFAFEGRSVFHLKRPQAVSDPLLADAHAFRLELGMYARRASSSVRPSEFTPWSWLVFL